MRSVRSFRILSALLCLLVLASLGSFGCGGGNGSSDGSSDGASDGATARAPEEVVQEFLRAMENKDIDAVFELLGPQYVADMLAKVSDQGLTIDELKQMSSEGMFPFDSIKFSDLKLKTNKSDDGTAVVTFVEGSYTQTSEGKTETMDVTDSDFPAEIHLVQVDGEWYVDLDATGGGGQ